MVVAGRGIERDSPQQEKRFRGRVSLSKQGSREGGVEQVLGRDRVVEKVIWRDRLVEQVLGRDRVVEKVLRRDREVEQVLGRDALARFAGEKAWSGAVLQTLSPNPKPRSWSGLARCSAGTLNGLSGGLLLYMALISFWAGVRVWRV